ncbi:MAG: diaminopimelate decarboxylase [Ichthyobacteriaceae bacterium]|nr:diaminopimelate decarboxylase [Ichthyobacteriaceae bacterium]
MYNNVTVEKFNNIQTPFYYYDIDVLKNTLETAIKASSKYNYHIHYAIKANANDRILDIIKDYGFGADCVSGNEVSKALEHGFAPETIAFAGVGKSDLEINTAINGNIKAFHVESVAELEVINELAAAKNKVVNVAFRLNPNVDAKTHAYITTGLSENKFGINPWELESLVEKLPEFKNLKLIGLHFHIGSQILDMSVYKELAEKANNFLDWFEANDIKLPYMNFGGGLGVDYDNPENKTPDFEAFFKVINENFNRRDNQEVHFELGRSLVATCGDMISKVLYIKKGLEKNFAIVDAGMTDLLRPALYKSKHAISNISSIEEEVKYDVVGPVCESSDVFATEFTMPKTRRGNLISFHTAGAYGQVMGSNYNLRDLATEYYSDEI